MLDLVLYAGDRLARVAGRNDIDPEPPRRLVDPPGSASPSACAARSRIIRLVAAVDTEQQLAWEARQRPRAAVAAALAALLGLGADLWSTAIVRGAPSSGFLDALQRAAEPGRFGAATSHRTAYFQWIDDHASGLIGSNVVKALSYLALAWALTFLAAATRARRPMSPSP